MNKYIRTLNYWAYNLKWWNWERFMFQLYLWRIGGLYAGYFTRPNQWVFPVRVKLFDLWNWLFVKKIYFKDNSFCPEGYVVNKYTGKKIYYSYDYEQEKSNPFRQKLDIRSVTASPGWDTLIFSLVKEIVKKGWNREVCQVKEKYGGLRFYINGATDEIHDLISKAEADSYDICEYCGSKDNVTQTEGWITSLCKNCMIKHKTK